MTFSTTTISKAALISLLLSLVVSAQVQPSALWPENASIVNDDIHRVAPEVDTADTQSLREQHVKSVTKWIYTLGRGGQQGTKSEVRMYDTKGNEVSLSASEDTSAVNLVRIYDNKGNESHYWEQLFGRSEHTFAYDTNGNRTEAVNKAPSTTKEQWKYDANNNCIQYLQLIDNKIQFSTQFLYDQNNRRIREHQLFFFIGPGSVVGASAASSTDTTYTFDAHGYPSEKEVIQRLPPNSPSSVHVSSSKRSYDSQGNLIEQTDYSPNNSVASRLTYSYDGKGKVLQKKFTLSSGPESVERNYSYSYDASGKIATISETRSRGGTAQPSVETTIYFYSYDASGRRLALISDSINAVQCFYYRYNDRRLLADLTNIGGREVDKYVYEYYQ